MTTRTTTAEPTDPSARALTQPLHHHPGEGGLPFYGSAFTVTRQEALSIIRITTPGFF